MFRVIFALYVISSYSSCTFFFLSFSLCYSRVFLSFPRRRESRNKNPKRRKKKHKIFGCYYILDLIFLRGEKWQSMKKFVAYSCGNADAIKYGKSSGKKEPILQKYFSKEILEHQKNHPPSFFKRNKYFLRHSSEEILEHQKEPS